MDRSENVERRPEGRQMALNERRSLVVVAIALVAAACSMPVALDPTPPAAGSTSEGSAASVSEIPRSGPIPRLIAFDSTGISSVEIDPNTETRVPLLLPAGRWTPTTGASEIVLSSLDRTKPTHIGVVSLIGTQHLMAEELTLPDGDMWLGAYAACVSPSGRIVIADAGLSLFLLHTDVPPDALPGQKDNLGHCTWLDETHLLWDEEGDQMAIWDSSTGKTAQLASPSGREPSAGGSRLAWTDAPGGTLFVSDFKIGAAGFALGHQLGSLPASAGSLSDDGRWLVASGPTVGTATVYDLSGTAFLAVARISLRPGEHARWLPIRQS
jgi:hypothetical protein